MANQIHKYKITLKITISIFKIKQTKPNEHTLWGLYYKYIVLNYIDKHAQFMILRRDLSSHVWHMCIKIAVRLAKCLFVDFVNINWFLAKILLIWLFYLSCEDEWSLNWTRCVHHAFNMLTHFFVYIFVLLFFELKVYYIILYLEATVEIQLNLNYKLK